MRTLKQIDAEISQQRNEVKTKLSTLLEERQKYFDTLFSVSKKLEKAIAAAETSCNFQFDQSGYIESWYRVSGGLSEFEECRDELANWLSDQGFTLDFENDCLLMCQGESIVINEDGDVFLDSKLIIDARNYSDEADRNAQIEAWMERNGYFPGVFESDRYGNVSLVNTLEGLEA